MTKDLKHLAKEANIPGISVAISKVDASVDTQIVGVTDVQTNRPVLPDTLFVAASLSKPVFAYIVLKMVEKGVFSRPDESPESGLTRPLYEIADFGPPHLRNDENYKRLTIEKILSHQSALPNECPTLESEKYLGVVGDGFYYSGVAYYILNTLLEEMTVLSLEEHTKVILQQGLGMTHTSFSPPQKGTPERERCALGHDELGKVDDTDHFPYGPHPAGSLVTTAKDYAVLLKTLHSDGFIRKYMFEPAITLTGNDKKAMDKGVADETLDRLSWGLGVGLQKVEGKTFMFQWGQMPTFRAFAVMDIQTGESAVCLTNCANGSTVFRSICEPILGNLNPIFDWLSLREGLKIEPQSSPHARADLSSINLAETYKSTLSVIKSSRDEASDVKSDHEKVKHTMTPLPTTPKK